MTELSMQQKREWAKTLYLKENLTQQEIAERVGVSRITVNNWIGKNGWEMLKTSITITREEQLSNAIKKMETEVGLSDIISVFSDLLKWLRASDPTQAKEVTPLLDAFVKSKVS